jgi:hypothetical protein
MEMSSKAILKWVITKEVSINLVEGRLIRALSKHLHHKEDL